MISDATQPGAYAFGEFRVDLQRRVLRQRGETVPLSPKVFATLLELVRHSSELVEKDALMRAVWPDTVVEENNLSQNIMVLRRVLQDQRGANRYIQTEPGRGYRFVADVRTLPSTPPQRPELLKVAVLPFENLSHDPEREYLADGLTEETIAVLGQVDARRIGVISRTAVMNYKRSSDTISRIGSELGVAYLVEGSLRAESGRLRVTAKLVRAIDQVQIWSASFDGEPRSMLEFQRELANAIATQVQLHLDPVRLAALGNRHSQNPEAFDAYLRGRHFWHQLTPATTRRAIEHFGSATRLDADYALAWSGIADALCARPITGDAPPLEVLPPAKEAVAQALRAQPDIAEVQGSVGFLKFWLMWDWRGAEAAFRRAIELDPGYSFPHRMLGLLYSHVGRTRESLPAMRRARELEPLLPVHHALSAQVAFAARDFPLATQFARQALVIDPDFWIGHWQLAQASIELGEHDVAMQALADAGRASGGNSKVLALRGYLHARHGRAAEARQVLRTLMATAKERYVPPCAIAQVHMGLGDLASTASWLAQAHDGRDVHLMFLQVDPKWDEARADPRVAAIIRRCGFRLDG